MIQYLRIRYKFFMMAALVSSEAQNWSVFSVKKLRIET